MFMQEGLMSKRNWALMDAVTDFHCIFSKESGNLEMYFELPPPLDVEVKKVLMLTKWRYAEVLTFNSGKGTNWFVFGTNGRSSSKRQLMNPGDIGPATQAA